MSTDYYKTLHNVNIQRKNLKNQFIAKNLMEQGLFEQAAQLQKPTTEAITGVSSTIAKLVPAITDSLTTSTTQQQAREDGLRTRPTPLEKVQNANPSKKYLPHKTEETKTVDGITYEIWKLGKSKYVFVEMNEKEYIHNLSITDYKPVELTEGLNNLLFWREGEITAEDITTWEELLQESSIPPQYKASEFYKKIIAKHKPSQTRTSLPRASKVRNAAEPKQQSTSATPIVEQQSMRPTVEQQSMRPTVELPEGDGLKIVRDKQPKQVLIIPENINDLANEFMLQIADTESGGNNTFNYTNALMKEMLRRKLITIKQYRIILKQYFHI